MVATCAALAHAEQKPNKRFFGGLGGGTYGGQQFGGGANGGQQFGGGAYGGQQFGGAAGLGGLAAAFSSLTGGLNGLGGVGGNGLGSVGGGFNGVGGGLSVGGGLGVGGGIGVGGGYGVGGGLGGVASSGSCRYWCRTPQGQSYCCESGQDLPSLPTVKPGQCPPVRPQCPPTRAGFRPPAQCSNDSRCPGAEKCCFDTCLQHHTCKLPTSYYG